MLRDERILLTKNKRIFEALLFLDSVSCQSNAQKQPEAGLFLVRQTLNMVLKEERILPTKSKRTFEVASL